MHDQQFVPEQKSAERLAFEYYLRTGRHLSPQTGSQGVEHKFNPYHDPRDGRFTLAPGGLRSLSHIIFSDRRSLHKGRQRDPGTMAAVNARVTSAPIRPARTSSISKPVCRPGEASATVQPAQYRPNLRARIGGNGSPPLHDPLTLGLQRCRGRAGNRIGTNDALCADGARHPSITKDRQAPNHPWCRP